MSPPAPDTAQQAQQALLRMQRSRDNLRGALIPAPVHASAAEAEAAASATARSAHAWPMQLWRWLARTPLAPTVKPAWRAVTAWWRQHPWRPAAEMVGSVAAGELRPAIRQHPVLAIAIGAGVGAVLVSIRPWRWMPRAAGLNAVWQVALTGALAAWVERATAPAPEQRPVHDEADHDVGPVRHAKPPATDTTATPAPAQ